MGPSLVARSIQALDDLRSALNRFSGDVTSALGANEGEIQRADSYLAQRERYWQGEVHTAEAEFQRATDALRTCQAYAAQAAQSGQGGVSCEREAATVGAAKARLDKMQSNLAEVRRVALRLQSEISVYQQSARGLRTIAASDAPRAVAFLT